MFGRGLSKTLHRLNVLLWLLQLFGVDLQVERDDVEVGLGREEGPEVRHIARRGAAGGGWAARLAVHEAGNPHVGADEVSNQRL